MSADPAEAEGAEGSNAAPAPSKPAPTKVAYHPNVRCLRGGGGVRGPGDRGPDVRTFVLGRVYFYVASCVMNFRFSFDRSRSKHRKREDLLHTSR